MAIYRAAAKVNLCLHVLSRQADGYHQLCMLMQRIGLFDLIEIELTAGSGVELECAGVVLPPGGCNLAERAARLLLDQLIDPPGVRIVLHKRIPVAAGLGGGSSDAATVLLALRQQLNVPLAQEQLMALGLRLGADVPFFLQGQPAWALGIGERLQPLRRLPNCWYVLLNPGVALSTAQVYGQVRHYSTAPRQRLYFTRTAELAGLLHNDLQLPAQGLAPAIEQAATALHAAGAEAVLLSGSGATLFALCDSEVAARQLAARLVLAPGWWLAVAEGLVDVPALLPAPA
ncbi:MAG: 4-(cytidine 5'-diphospho)-2-C-methyl-D-erythritol kinase [Desulfuromonas thiophila]|nr:4-(cytidine 5'-diphospho)-2-C-methyl-D-erythritol kinase [Desulfuromonas thiophila]